jgi:carbamoyl-phosphate synthase large subunit
MPRRDDLHKILLIGSGPIIIGQACEFDYSGTQACKALREEGYTVVLVNSNPATIMTDPETADRTYIEPIHWEILARIIERERPDAILPTVGGQTALNTAMDLHRHGVLEQYHVEMIGANPACIEKAEDREKFKQAMLKIGIDVPRSAVVRSEAEALAVRDSIGLPCVLRPSFTLGGTGGGIAYNREEYAELIKRGLDLSPVGEVLVEESVIGWKEFELEVMRDKADNVVIICSIENLDPMGVHTGDSITVAPAQTLTDKEYQRMRDAALAIIREIGVETGGSNIQFAVNPRDGKMVAIEMNPRVSRSSALASKATGFPIAKIAAKLAVGYRLDELRNDITRETRACFEPTIDYVVTKVPRWAFEKFPDADPTLTTQMKSVGETMAIGRTFKESLQKALRGLETGSFGLGCDRTDRWDSAHRPSEDEIRAKLARPNSERIWYIRYAFKAGMSVEDVHHKTSIDPWFLHHIHDIVRLEERLRAVSLAELEAGDRGELRRLLLEAKQYGFSDHQLGHIWHRSGRDIRQLRKSLGVVPSYKLVDTCAAEFEAYTPYYYSTYESPAERVGEGGGCEPFLEDEAAPRGEKDRIMVLGGGPNRIGQGIEFDYCCCQAAYALSEAGYETIMVNSNPETVSTDYDTSDYLFFEPLTAEDVLNICDRMQPKGLIVQFGGQTPLNLARALELAGAPIIGTSVDSIDIAEDRDRFQALVARLGLKQPDNGTALDAQQAVLAARRIGYPVLVRPSYVLGGRGMEIVYDEPTLVRYMQRATETRPLTKPILIDKFLEAAIEVDVDCLADGEQALIGGVMQHIEEAGIHSGDSACVIPPFSLPPTVIEEIKRQTRALARELKVRGLMNVQFAVSGLYRAESGELRTESQKAGSDSSGASLSTLSSPLVYVLEVNPRASRTVPFVSKATGIPLARAAALVMVGKSLRELGLTREVTPGHYSIKESVFPFNKFPGVDIILGPEMRSTGEVMGIDDSFPMAFAKSQLAASSPLPRQGMIFISVADRDKKEAIHIARALDEMGYELLATRGTVRELRAAGIHVEEVSKLQEGRPNLIDYLLNDRIALVINTPSGKGARTDEARIRMSAVARGVTCITTLSAAWAAVEACRALKARDFTVAALQDRFPDSPRPATTAVHTGSNEQPISSR